MGRQEGLRVYIDTSVFGGVFDNEFSAESKRFLDLIGTGGIVGCVSSVVVREIASAPIRVRRLFESLASALTQATPLTENVLRLREEYLNAGVLSRRFVDDATHVAAATISRVDAIVSWNFKHLVRLDKIRCYNEVNVRYGYDPIAIVSPQEIRLEEEDDDHEKEI